MYCAVGAPPQNLLHIDLIAVDLFDRHSDSVEFRIFYSLSLMTSDFIPSA